MKTLSTQKWYVFRNRNICVGLYCLKDFGDECYPQPCATSLRILNFWDSRIRILNPGPCTTPQFSNQIDTAGLNIKHQQGPVVYSRAHCSVQRCQSGFKTGGRGPGFKIRSREYQKFKIRRLVGYTFIPGIFQPIQAYTNVSISENRPLLKVFSSYFPVHYRI